MSTRRLQTALLAVIATIAIPATIAHAADLAIGAEVPDGQHIVVTWNWFEIAGAPVDYPQWVGYDLFRRTTGSCDPPVRLNTDPFPRVVGQSHTGSFTELAPAQSTTFEYQIVPVDASHQPIVMSSTDCVPPCQPQCWVSCPVGSGVVTIATVADADPLLLVRLVPCTDGCWPGFVANATPGSPLRQFIGTGQMLAFYGGTTCMGGGDCTLYNISHYELAGCGPTPTTPPSWGGVKIRYR